jgi:hypothetical protein
VLSLDVLFALGLPLFGLALTDLDSATLYCTTVSDDRAFGSILSNLVFISFSCRHQTIQIRLI